MDALKLEYEDKMRQERSPEDPEPILRTRQEVGKKLIELGLAADASDFGKIRRATGGRRKKTIEDEAQLEELADGGGIAVMKKKKWKKRPVRQAASPELQFDTREEFSDEERVGRWHLRNTMIFSRSPSSDGTRHLTRTRVTKTAMALNRYLYVWVCFFVCQALTAVSQHLTTSPNW